MTRKILFLCALYLFPAFCHAGTQFIENFGAYPDDGYDDTDQIQAALDSGDTIYFSDGVYLIDSNLSTNNPASINSVFLAQNDQMATIKSSNADGNIINLKYFKGMDKFTFDNVRLRVHGISGSGVERRVRWNEFINMNSGTWCISLDRAASVPYNINIYQNHFQGCHYAVAGYAAHSAIQYNTSNNGVQRHIWMSGADNVKINNNRVTGGVVGVGFPCRDNGSDISSNTIKNNILNDISEEGISFDMQGNNQNSCSRWFSEVLGWDVDSSGDVDTLFVEGDAGNLLDIDTPSAVVVFVDSANANKGTIYEVTGKGVSNGPFSGKPYINIADGPASSDIQAGYQFIVLSIAVKDNQIIDNQINNTGRTAIGLHGAGINTLISGNTIDSCNTPPDDNQIWGGIVLRNINNALATKGGHGPVFFNTVSSNTLKGQGCDIKAFNLNYTGSAVFYSIGNSKQYNTLLDSADDSYWLDQE